MFVPVDACVHLCGHILVCKRVCVHGVCVHVRVCILFVLVLVVSECLQMDQTLILNIVPIAFEYIVFCVSYGFASAPGPAVSRPRSESLFGTPNAHFGDLEATFSCPERPF